MFHKKFKGLLCKLGAFRSVKAIDKVCSRSSTWVDQLVVNDHDLKKVNSSKIDQ